MNSLYFIRTYEQRPNHYARFIVTAPSYEDAQKKVHEYVGDGWSTPTGRFVCFTPDTVFTEV